MTEGDDSRQPKRRSTLLVVTSWMTVLPPFRKSLLRVGGRWCRRLRAGGLPTLFGFARMATQGGRMNNALQVGQDCFCPVGLGYFVFHVGGNLIHLLLLVVVLVVVILRLATGSRTGPGQGSWRSG